MVVVVGGGGGRAEGTAGAREGVVRLVCGAGADVAHVAQVYKMLSVVGRRRC